MQELHEKYKLLYKIGVCLRADRRNPESIQWLFESHEGLKDHMPGEKSWSIRARNALSGSYLANGQVEQALNLFDDDDLVKNDNPD